METFIQETMLDDVSICDGLIEYHKNNMEYKIAGKTTAGVGKQKVSTDVGVMVHNNNPIMHMYMSQLIKAVKIYGEKYGLSMDINLKETINIQHYAPNEGFFGWHCERSTYQSHQRALVFMTYLNDVTDGGETEFYFQKLKVKPVKGKMVIWPTDFTHFHRGITSPTQDKYIATGWLNFFDVVDFQKLVK